MKRINQITFPSFKISLVILLCMGFYYSCGAEKSNMKVTDACAKIVETNPRMLKTPPPIYPAYAKEKLISGRVVVKIILAKDGAVKDPVVIESMPKGIFDEAAIEAVKKWEFQPATKCGEPVDAILKLPLNFGIDPEETEH